MSSGYSHLACLCMQHLVEGCLKHLHGKCICGCTACTYRAAERTCCMTCQGPAACAHVCGCLWGYICAGVSACTNDLRKLTKERLLGDQAAARGGRPHGQCHARFRAAHVSPACAEGSSGLSVCVFHVFFPLRTVYSFFGYLGCAFWVLVCMLQQVPGQDLHAAVLSPGVCEGVCVEICMSVWCLAGKV